MKTGKVLAGTAVVAVLSLAVCVVLGASMVLASCEVNPKDVERAEQDLDVFAGAFAAEAVTAPGPADRTDEELGQVAGRHDSKVVEVARSPAGVAVTLRITATYRIPGSMPGVVKGCRRVLFSPPAAAKAWTYEVIQLDRCPT